MRRRRERRGRAGRHYWLFLLPAALAVGVLVVVPLCLTIYYSLRDFNLQFGTNTFVGLENYVSILTGGDPLFVASLIRTLVYVAAVVAADFCIAMIQALLIFEMRARFAMVWRAVFLLPILVIPTASAVFWQEVMYAPNTGQLLLVLGLDGTVPPLLGTPGLAFLGIIITVVWAWSPWVFLLLSAGLDTLDTRLIEAGKVDGASYVARLRYIVLPLMRPVIFIVLAFKALDSFLSFSFVWVMTGGGPGNSTHLMSTYIYQRAFEQLDYGAGSALAVVMLLIGGGLALAVVLLWQRLYGREF